MLCHPIHTHKGSEKRKPGYPRAGAEVECSPDEPGLVAQPDRRVEAAPAPPQSNPLGEDFDYAEEFAKLDVEALKADMI